MTLKCHLKKSKGRWVTKLPEALRAYRTTSKATTSETPYSLTYGTEVVLSVEMSHPICGITTFDESNNYDALGRMLGLLEEHKQDL